MGPYSFKSSWKATYTKAPGLGGCETHVHEIVGADTCFGVCCDSKDSRNSNKT